MEPKANRGWDGLEIYHQLEFRRLFNWPVCQVGRISRAITARRPLKRALGLTATLILDVESTF
jgi:hypothetical protein